MKHSFFFAAAILIFGSAKSQDKPPTVTIGNQTWMVKNLDVDHYRNGDPIPEVKDSAKWVKLTTGAWCYYNNDPANGKTYGKLYNWYAVNDPRGLAPKGWRVPVLYEWVNLSTALGGDKVAGGKMKEAGTAHWTLLNIKSSNSSGFTGLPGGVRTNNGTFYGVRYHVSWWSSTKGDTTVAWNCSLAYYSGGIIYSSNNIKQVGFSVRCVRD